MDEHQETGKKPELTLEALVQALGGEETALAFIRGDFKLELRTCKYCGHGELILSGPQHGTCQYKLALIDAMHRRAGYGY